MTQLRKAERRFKLATQDYGRLAAFRRTLREFLHFSEAAAAAAGITAQSYQALLIIRACPDGQTLTINDLARELLIKHNSAVGLVDRLVQQGLVLRVASTADRRKVELRLTTQGRRVMARLAAMHRRELERIGPLIQVFFSELSVRRGTSARRSRKAAAR